LQIDVVAPFRPFTFDEVDDLQHIVKVSIDVPIICIELCEAAFSSPLLE
jgi:hypothetical protein